jgi:hypothetical protein
MRRSFAGEREGGFGIEGEAAKRQHTIALEEALTSMNYRAGRFYPSQLMKLRYAAYRRCVLDR